MYLVSQTGAVWAATEGLPIHHHQDLEGGKDRHPTPLQGRDLGSPAGGWGKASLNLYEDWPIED